MADEFENMMNTLASDKAWRDEVKQVSIDAGVGNMGVRPGIYQACFNTPAGREVLKDLYNRYVNVTRYFPGEPEGSGHFREGGAQVVFDIAATIEAAAQGEDNE